MPSQQLNKNKEDITCNCTDHTTKWILKNSFENDKPLIFKQNSTKISINNQKHISEVESLLEYFYKIKHTYINRKLISKIFSNFEFNIAFYYYQDSLFDVFISLEYSKYSKGNIFRDEYISILKTPLNSSILSKTLKKDSWIKQLIFSTTEFYVYPTVIRVSFSANTLAIDLYKMNPDYLNLLLELWPGLILRLENLKYNNKCWDLDLIQRFLSYCGRCPPCWKLSFSKVVINIDIDNIYNFIFIETYENVSKLKHLIDSWSKIYDVEFEDITYKDLFINRIDYFKKFIGRRRDKYNYAKLKFERTLKYSRIECYLDDFFNNTNDGFNQTIKEELKLKEFEFYADKIHMDRYD